MDAIEAMARGLSGRADLIRRQFWRDPEFRTVCEDYRDVLEVLARLDADPAQPSSAGRAEEYRELAAELLAEAAQMLAGGRT